MPRREEGHHACRAGRASTPYNVVFDTFGDAKRVLGPAGALVLTLPGPNLILGKLSTLLGKVRVEFHGAVSKRADLELLASWMTSGLAIPVAAELPARELASAFEKLASGRLLGKIAIRVKDGL